MDTKLKKGGFTIDTPYGHYSPDRAVVWEQAGEAKLYFIVETKADKTWDDLFEVEQIKIECAKKHFDAVGEIDSFNCVSSFNDFKAKFKNIYIQIVEKPARKVIIKRGKNANDYYEYCQEVSCDVWGILTSIKSISPEPVCMWLSKKYIKKGTSRYVRGTEVALDYSDMIPDGFDIIELPATQFLLFCGEPFDEEYFEEAIREIWAAEKKYNPEFLGYTWDDENPRIQLEPIGARGYMELLPIKRL